MSSTPLPPIWLIILIAGLAQLSETIYTPSLPDIARSLGTSETLVEHTLTIYLFGFGLGVLFWGRLSDKLGRKPCVLAGLFIFIVGCLGCYYSGSITELMASRLVQAFGGSIGSVLSQSICRDAFHGPVLGRVYSIVGGAFAIFPAVGPTIGGLIAENYGWSHIFLILMGVAVVIGSLVVLYLPETHPREDRKRNSVLGIALRLLTDKKVIGAGLIVAACNGIHFSYFSEGSFYFIKTLGLTPSSYGMSFTCIAFASFLGSMLCKKLHETHTSQATMQIGILIILFATASWSSLIIGHVYTDLFPNAYLIMLTIAAYMVVIFGIAIVTSTALALALVDYKDCTGTASSLFGFFYYICTSLVTLIMGFLHNGTLLPMPLYFLGLSVFLLVIQRYIPSRI